MQKPQSTLISTQTIKQGPPLWWRSGADRHRRTICRLVTSPSSGHQIPNKARQPADRKSLSTPCFLAQLATGNDLIVALWPSAPAKDGVSAIMVP
ncbi:hypothetical protein BaRGS_00015038, partial [Batillaria attramentaria]